MRIEILCLQEDDQHRALDPRGGAAGVARRCPPGAGAKNPSKV